MRTRICYKTETVGKVERVFAIAYTHERETGKTTYGASVFRRDAPSENYTKADLRKTALARLELRPIEFVFVADHLSKVEDAIREHIRTHGVKGERK